MQAYDDLGLDNRLRRTKLKSEYISALDEDTRVEKSRLVNNQVTKGTMQTTSGGLVEFNSTSGGTILLTVDPVTGTVTLAGPVLANVVLNVGSMNNGGITGASSLTGTLTNTGVVSGGTFNNITVGTSRSVGGTINTTKIESPVFTVNAGSNPLDINGAVDIQTVGGSAIIAVRHTGTTYRFTPAGIL